MKLIKIAKMAFFTIVVTLFAATEAYAGKAIVITDSDCGSTQITADTGDTIILGTDLVAAGTGYCIYINGVSRVKVNLNGHTITGDATECSVGATMNGQGRGIQIRNSSNVQIVGPGRIDGFRFGVASESTSSIINNKNIVRNVLLTCNSNAGILFNSTTENSKIEQNILFGNDSGIRVSNDSSYNDVISNEVFGNRMGILIDNTGPHDNMVQGNNVVSNTQDGILAINSAYDNVIEGNIMLNNVRDLVESSTGDQFIDNNLCETENTSPTHCTADSGVIQSFSLKHDL